MSIRKIARVMRAEETLEGAGVHLHRGFGYPELPLFDPFLLFDDFSSPFEADYRAGFPLHPHRGIETVTYILKGDVTHKDSIGNKGTITAGDVQWMNAGSGIVHEEMPHGQDGLAGFQLWVNLPRAHKMMDPQYQEIHARDIPTVTENGASIHIISGTYKEMLGPVRDIVASPTYLDVTLEPESSITIPVPEGDTSFLYIIDGTLVTKEKAHERGSLLLYEREGDSVMVNSADSTLRFLFVSGTPLNEPIAWHGPIVMNTQEEIAVALYDLQNGTFIK